MRIRIALVVISCISIHAFGQQAEAVRVLTFQEAIKMALENGVTMNQQRNNLEMSQMSKTTSLASLGPSVNANISASQINGNSFNPNTGQVVNGVRDNVNANLSARLNLFTGLTSINTVRQYTSQLEAQSHFVNRTAQDVMNIVSTQYLKVMQDVELLKIAKQNLEQQEKQLEQIKEMVRLGSKSPVDEYNQDAQTKAAELRFVLAEIELANDKSLLSQTLLMDAFEEFDVEKPNWDIIAIGNETLNVAELADQAKQFRGDYMRAVKTEESSKYSMYAARGSLMPALTAFGVLSSGYNYQHDVPKTITHPITGEEIDNPNYPRPFGEQFRTNNVSKQYGLQLSIPLFNGLQNKATVVQQKITYKNNTLARQNIELQIRNDVLRAVRNYEGVKKAFTVTTDQLTAAEQAFSLETERYNLGVTNFVDYISANRVLVQAQTDRAQAEYRLVFQRIMLEYAVGTLKPEEFQK